MVQNNRLPLIARTARRYAPIGMVLKVSVTRIENLK